MKLFKSSLALATLMRPGFGEEVEEPEEKESFDASRQLEIMLNPLEHTNRFLRYEFMKERNGITQAGFHTDIRLG